jgi:voltage-gated potassium channel
VLLVSIESFRILYQEEFLIIEWILMILFTLVFLLRIWISPYPLGYIFSLWGAIDFLAILPTYLSLLFFNYHYLLIVRIFRLLRVFRILKLARFTREVYILLDALKTSMHKVSVFFVTILAIVIFMGTLMYVVEGGEKGFTNIPQSIYWAIVTVTTVGYGDMVPHTVLGKIISSVVMIIGYAIIAVPTGIITVAIANSRNETKICAKCHFKNDPLANYCSNCGTPFEIQSTDVG